jgi:hypothetical protein
LYYSWLKPINAAAEENVKKAANARVGRGGKSGFSIARGAFGTGKTKALMHDSSGGDFAFRPSI